MRFDSPGPGVSERKWRRQIFYWVMLVCFMQHTKLRCPQVDDLDYGNDIKGLAVLRRRVRRAVLAFKGAAASSLGNEASC
eukprot:scaffold113773_cov15-Prasinocladus_malaysianus.AAC.1